MILARDNCLIEQVLKVAKIHHLHEIIKTTSASDIEKFDLLNFDSYSNVNHERDKKLEIPEQKLGSPYLRY